MNTQTSSPSDATRRDFLKTGAAAVAGLGLVSALAPPVHAAGSDTLKIALIGCGNRGTGALVQALSTKGSVQLWALADTFPDRIESCLQHTERELKGEKDEAQGKKKKGKGNKAGKKSTGSVADKINVPKERQFVGLDAYRKAIDSGIDLVLLAEAPGYRPQHFEYAINSGKHVFMEKPVATDPAGIRRVLAAAEEAKKKNLKVGVGLQRRHQAAYQEAIEKIHKGELGDLIALRAYWNGGHPAKQPYPHEGLSELEYQVRNWYFFSWLSGDHICEQHVHNLDVCNWVKGAHPVEAEGLGGRQVRTGKEYGNIYDHHAVEFTYADGTKMFSQCRQIPGCANKVAECIHGTKGLMNLDAGRAEMFVNNKRTWRVSGGEAGYSNNAYQVEHDALFDAIRNDKPYNEAEYGATSTMTAILGRMATYSGQIVKWDEAIKSNHMTTTDAEKWDAKAPVEPNSDGRYVVAMPGTTKVV
jgi:myo-inositol 2-dehydrogenase / D-chiro-inositol 1-dehydrogenase